MVTELIRIKVFTQGGDEHDIETPTDITCSEFIQEFVLALKFPVVDAEGKPAHWRIDNKDTGKTLEPEKTLKENGVRDGHYLSLIRQVTAGGPEIPYHVRDVSVWKSAPLMTAATSGVALASGGALIGTALAGPVGGVVGAVAGAAAGFYIGGWRK